MTDLFKKAALFHAELVSVAAEKVKEVADDFVRRGILDDTESRRFVVDVREKLTNAEREFETKWQRVSKAGQDLLTELKITPKVQPEKLDGRIGDLERQLDELRLRRETIKHRNGQAKKDSGKKDEVLV